MQRFAPLFLLAALACAAPPETFRQFQDPPKTYSVRPFWFWNGLLTSAEVDRQIREMVSQHVYGAYVHNRTGLQTPYLSDDYFAIVKSGYESARRHGFLFGLVDEYEWPGGEARDPWSPGLGSRVIARNPDFRMRSLWFTSKDANGPAHLEITGVKNYQFAVAAKLTSDTSFDSASFTVVPGDAARGTVAWDAPAGRWRLMAFYLEPSQGRDGGLVDLMSHDAIHTWLQEVHEKYYHLGPDHFGSTIDSFFSDHEGDYGRRIAWTPLFFETFQKMKGYDMRPFLPALMFDSGHLTPKVRCDYLDVVSELYTQSYMRQVTEWCEQHHIKISGHVWEENLVSEAAAVGDLMRVERAWSWPGVDSLHDLGRWPRDLKATASVAHFRGTRFTVENQGVQGGESYLDPQKMRLGTNMLGVWGTSLFIPHAFNYNPTRIEFPSDWFFHQPYWKYFKYYADYARRIAYMNDGGRHFADILLFQPTETAWAHSDTNFSPSPDWDSNPLPKINLYYGDLMDRMSQELRDYDVADSFYLNQASLDGPTIHIANETYRVLVLPPTTTMRRATLRKIRAFYEQGGTVIAVNTLPTDSMEEGRNDPQILADVKAIFQTPAAGKAFFIRENVDDLFPILDANLPRDIAVLNGSHRHLGALHRAKGGLDYFWMVNDSVSPRDQRFLLRAKGIPEKWDASTGQRSPLESRATAQGTEVKLHFDPWDAFYVVFGNPDAKPATPARPLPKLADIPLAGTWRLTPENRSLAAPYGRRYQQVWDGLGETKGFADVDFDDARWTDDWLSRERLTVRDWWLVGPFPNEDHAGCYGSFPPESNPDVKATYDDLKWKRYAAPTAAVDLYSALGLAIGSNGTAYALTYVYSPVVRRVQFRVAANNNAYLWVNGQKLLDWHIHPWYYEMREDFALTREADLHAGWNPVLLKVSRFRRGAFTFMLRVTDANGDNLTDLTFSPDRALRPAGSTNLNAWYRVPVPATATAVELTRFRKPYKVWYNGQPAAADARGVIHFPAAAEGPDNILTLKLALGDEFQDTPKFTLDSAKAELGSWLDRGLPYFSGSAAYEKEFELPANYVGRKLTLDCGEVGVVAEVWVNDKPAGVRVWLPFSFDITSLVKPGRNKVKILVTNTMTNERAVDNHARLLGRLHHSGLIGPVTIQAK
jgi:hypothetical protein